jgi:hypothetical protein
MLLADVFSDFTCTVSDIEIHVARFSPRLQEMGGKRGISNLLTRAARDFPS